MLHRYRFRVCPESRKNQGSARRIVLEALAYEAVFAIVAVPVARLAGETWLAVFGGLSAGLLPLAVGLRKYYER